MKAKGCCVITSSSAPLPSGTRIAGKWNKRVYVVERLLGEGANGRVYLVRSGRTYAAMKTAFDPLDLQAEINALKALESADGIDPYLLDADDGQAEGSSFSFYVMKYIHGVPLADFLASRGSDWFGIVARGLLERLCDLHRKGYIFGDLKPDNMLVTGYGRVELVDFGGVTRKGKAVRQFTEVWDRGFWKAGSRRADEGYDLFAFALVCIQAADPLKELGQPGGLPPERRNRKTLKDMLARCRMNEAFKGILREMIDGRLNSSERALAGWRQAMLAPPKAAAPGEPLPLPWLAGALAVSAALCLASIVWTLQ